MFFLIDPPTPAPPTRGMELTASAAQQDVCGNGQLPAVPVTTAMAAVNTSCTHFSATVAEVTAGISFTTSLYISTSPQTEDSGAGVALLELRLCSIPADLELSR